jgi:hypothetical protein
LTAALNFSSAALQRCRATVLDDESAAKLDNLDTELEDGQRTRFQATSLRLEPDGFMTGMNLVYRIETMTELYCGDSSPMHRALLLIGIKHGAGEQ